MELKDIKIYPEWIQDWWKYILVMALICVISALLSKWKEKRRLKKEFAEYQQRREDERKENGDGKLHVQMD